MVSTIDPTKPTSGTALTADVRANFAAAKAEIEALQNGTGIVSLGWSVLTDTPTTLSGYGISDAIPASEKGAANGVATLDSAGKIPSSQLTVDALEYKGTWDADANDPDLSSLTPSTGDVYRVSVAGTTNLDGEDDWAVGDLAVYNGATWDKWAAAARLLTPASSTDNALVRWDGTGGNSLQSSAWVLEDDGTLAGAGNVNLTAATTETRQLQIGHGRAGDGISLIDLVGDATNANYGTRLVRLGGTAGETQLLHKGTGSLQIRAEDAAEIRLYTDDTLRFSVSSAGAFNFQGNAISGALTGDDPEVTDATYTTTAADIGKWKNITHASGCTVTLHNSPGEGAEIGFIQRGAGKITFAVASGTLRQRQGHTKSAGQYAMCLCVFRDGEWHLGGDTAA